MPRGPLDTAAGALQLQWRGVASSLYELFEGETHAVSYEGDAPIRPTPGYRNIAVHSVEDRAEAAFLLARFGVHLKALGVAPAGADLSLPPGLAPRVSPPGRMQTPPLLAATDGLPPWHGLVRVR